MNVSSGGSGKFMWPARFPTTLLKPLNMLSISSRRRELPNASPWSRDPLQLFVEYGGQVGRRGGTERPALCDCRGRAQGKTGETRVAVVPVTHTAPPEPDASIELPHSVKLALGLDEARSWVRLDELSVFSWPGYDLRLVPGTDRIDYGSLPQPLFEQVRRGVVALNQSRRTRRVGRD